MKDQPLYLAKITVREWGGSYLARLNGKTASATSGAESAARAVLRKLDPDNTYTVQVLAASQNGRSEWTVVKMNGKVGRRET